MSGNILKIYFIKNAIKAVFRSPHFHKLVAISLRAIRPSKYRELTESKICIYSACFGQYDTFQAPIEQTLNHDTLLFTDHPPPLAPGTKVVLPYTLSSDPREAAKVFKINSHSQSELLEYDVLVWLDASARIQSPYFLEILLMLSDGLISMRRHPDRHSVLSEAQVSERMAKYADSELVKQAEGYLAAGLVDDHLWHCSLIVRRRGPESIIFNCCWWQEMQTSLQDQISAPYAEFRSGLRISELPRLFTLLSLITYSYAHRENEYLPKKHEFFQ